MASGATSVRFDQLRSMPYTQITSSFQPIGFVLTPTTPAPFTHAMRVIEVQNTTDGDMFISFDGTTINIRTPAMSFSLYDLTSDQDANESVRYQNGTQMSVAYSTAPSKGYLDVTATYVRGE